MPDEQLYSQFADLAALEAEKKQVISIFEEVKAGIKDLSSFGLKLDSSKTMKEMNDAINALAKKEQELVAAQKKIAESQAQIAALMAKTTEETKKQDSAIKGLSTVLSENIERQIQLKDRLAEVQANIKKLSAFKDAAKDSKEFTDEMIRLTAEQAQLKIELQSTNKLINNQTKEFLASSGSLDETRARINKLVQVYDALSEAQRASEGGQALKKQIADLDAELKKLEGQTGRFQRNVGNYAGSLGNSFELVRREIVNLQREQSKLQGIGDVRGAEAAGRQLQELDNITRVAFDSTKNYTQQVKALEKSYIDLATSGNFSKEFLNEFKNSIGEAKDAANDLKESINLAASDTRGLDVLIGGAQAVAGGFALVQGAAALAGDENEDLQRTLVKLNAVMTILNGLQAIQAELKKKDNILTVAQIGLQKAYAFAVGTSTGAMKAFRIALAATGVGLLVIGIGTLISKLGSYKSASDEASDATKRLTVELDIQNRSLNENLAAIDTRTKLIIARLKRDGASQVEINTAILKGLIQRKLETDKAVRSTLELSSAFRSAGEQTRLDIVVKDAKTAAFELKRIELELATVQDESKKASLESSKNFLSGLLNNYNQQAEAQTNLTETIINQQGERSNKQREQAKKNAEEALKQIEAEKKAALELANFRKQIEADAAGELADAEGFTGSFRIQKAKEQADALKQIIKDKQSYELDQENLTTSQLKLINEKAALDIAKIEVGLQKKIIEINLQTLQQRKELVDDGSRFYADRAEANQKALDKELAQAAIFRDEYLKSLNKNYQDGLTTLEEYNERKLKAEFDYQAQVLRAEIAFYTNQLDISTLTDEQRLELKGKIAEAEVALANLVTERKIENDEKEKKSSEEKTQKLIDDLKKVEKIYNEFAEVIGGIFDAIATSQLNDIEAQLEALEKRKAKEIEVVEQTVQGEQDKAARIKVIEARAQSEKEALERRQKQVRRQQAAFDKANTIAKIVIDTASAVVEALPNIPLSILSGIIGAAQLAVAIATPLPQFAKGKKASDPYEGPGIVGEAGREIGISKSGKVTLYDRPSLVHLAKGDTILPNRVTEDILRANDMAILASFKHFHDKPVSQDSINEHLIEQYTDKVVKAIKRVEDKPVHVIKIHNDASFQAYIEFHTKL